MDYGPQNESDSSLVWHKGWDMSDSDQAAVASAQDSQ